MNTTQDVSARSRRKLSDIGWGIGLTCIIVLAILAVIVISSLKATGPNLKIPAKASSVDGIQAGPHNQAATQITPFDDISEREYFYKEIMLQIEKSFDPESVKKIQSIPEEHFMKALAAIAEGLVIGNLRIGEASDDADRIPNLPITLAVSLTRLSLFLCYHSKIDPLKMNELQLALHKNPHLIDALAIKFDAKSSTGILDLNRDKRTNEIFLPSDFQLLPSADFTDDMLPVAIVTLRISKDYGKYMEAGTTDSFRKWFLGEADRNCAALVKRLEKNTQLLSNEETGHLALCFTHPYIYDMSEATDLKVVLANTPELSEAYAKDLRIASL